MRKIKKDTNPLAGFFTHGVRRDGIERGNQYETNCIFCQRDGKLYINRKNLCWDCKVCGLKGNYLDFLKNVAAYNLRYIRNEHLQVLADDRMLPFDALKDWGIGFDGQKFTLPIYDYNSKFCGLKNFFINFTTNRMQNQKGTKPALYGADKLRDHMKGTIFICEGEWDAIAMNWLLHKLRKTDVAVAVPSAQTFSDDWVELFFRRNVVCIYDNDNAGKMGEEKAYALLKDVCLSLSFVHWPSARPEGFDTKDFISEMAYRHEKPKRCWREINELIHSVPRSLASVASYNEKGKLELDPKYKEKLEPITFEELIKAFREYLYLPDITPIKVVMAAIFANRIDGEMIWMFLVAPPSSAKSEFIQSLDLLDVTVPISRLTTHTLSSGFVQNTGKKEVSLLPKLNGKIAILKDFTGVLTMHPKDQDDIFGQLRDAYDGRTDYYYGHGQNKHYKSKFGLIAGVTEVIERLNGSGSLHTALGERFLRYRLPKDFMDASNIANSDIMHKMGRAMFNSGSETKHKESLMMSVKRFIEAGTKDFVATVPEKIADKLKYLAWFTSRMRGFVDRDREGNVNYTPGSESPIRLVKQLYRLIIGLARVENKREVDIRDLEIVRKVALDTCPSRIVLFIKTLYEAKGPLQYKEISIKADFDAPTVGAVLNDLFMLKLVKFELISGKKFYSLSTMSKELILKGDVFTEPEERVLPSLPMKLLLPPRSQRQ